MHKTWETIYLHRYLLGILGSPRDEVVDFIDGNPRDCRRRNMRVCTKAQQLANTMIDSQNSSSMKGITFDKPSGLWVASISIQKNGKRAKKHRSGFALPADAALAYDEMARELYSEHAHYNFPRPGERSAISEPPSELRIFASVIYARSRGILK